MGTLLAKNIEYAGPSGDMYENKGTQVSGARCQGPQTPSMSRLPSAGPLSTRKNARMQVHQEICMKTKGDGKMSVEIGAFREGRSAS